MEILYSILVPLYRVAARMQGRGGKRRVAFAVTSGTHVLDKLEFSTQFYQVQSE